MRILARFQFNEPGSSTSRPRTRLWYLLFSRQPPERIVVEGAERSRSATVHPPFDPKIRPGSGRTALRPDNGQSSSRRVLYPIRISILDFNHSRERTFSLRRNLAPRHRPVGYERIRTRLRNSTALPLLHVEVTASDP